MSVPSNTKEILRKYIADTSFIKESIIKDDSLIFKEGLFDSMGFISMIAFLEEKFNIQIKDNELVDENFESLNAIHQYLINKSQIH